MYLSSSCKRTPRPPSIMGSYNHPGPSKPNLSLKKKRNMKEKFDSYLSHYTCKKKKDLGCQTTPPRMLVLVRKLMFTRIPRNVMSSWWWRLHPATGFTSQCCNPPPQRVLSALPKITLASTWTTAAWSSAASCRKGLVRRWLCWWVPVWKKKNIRMAGWFRKPLEILKKSFVEELETTREARNQQANSPHSTYHPNPCQPLKKVPPLPSSASLPHSHAEPKEWRGGCHHHVPTCNHHQLGVTLHFS